MYASCLNHIERLQRWLKQDVVHPHSFGDDWAQLKASLQAFMGRFTGGSEALLRYTGLSSA